MVRLFKQKLSQVFGCFPLDCRPRLAFFPTRLRPYCPLAFSRLIDSYKKRKKKKKTKKEKKLTAVVVFPIMFCFSHICARKKKKKYSVQIR